MFANIKNRFISAMAPDLAPLPNTMNSDYRKPGASHHRAMSPSSSIVTDKFEYARPPFLQLLTHDEIKASADHNVRPIIVPRDINLLPFLTGYAECVNSGKSEWNEDQGAFCRQILSDPSHQHPDLPYTYFGIFDGHAGYGAALAASHQFHYILHEKLVDCIDMLLPRENEDAAALASKSVTNGFPHPSHFQKRVTKDDLITGALESAFFHMDSLIAQDRDRYRDAGGCTACVSLFIHGKMYVANAGDSRAVLCLRKGTASKQQTTNLNTEDDDNMGSYPLPFSFDHTPETERHRLLNVARLKPHLMGKYYAAMEYAKRPHAKDLGQRILCRQGTMKGWTHKTLTRDDLRMPVVMGEGKRSRLLGTLGVTRGFGDHDLLAINTGTQIKPFLTPHPDVTHRDLTKIVCIPGENSEDGEYGVLVMATDGLWDVSENESVARTVFQTLAKYPIEKHRYTMAAQELVAKARGKINDSGHWRLADSKAAATVDDISVIVIPVYQYYKEHLEWESKCVQEHQERLKKRAAQHLATEAKESEDDTESQQNGEKAIVEEEVNAGEISHLIDPKSVLENDVSRVVANIVQEKLPSSETEPTSDAQLNETTAILEATNISTAESDNKEESSNPTNSSPNKKSNQHQRNRNRKDNKQR